MALVFVRKSVLESTNRDIARYLRFDVHGDSDSLFNTPPVFTVYMVGKVLEWMKVAGGLGAIEAAARDKAAIIYRIIDASDDYYRCPVDVACRSHMNVVFRLPTEALEARFVTEATAAGLLNLKGHRSVGGCRASLYNAMPVQSVEVLGEFMGDLPPGRRLSAPRCRCSDLLADSFSIPPGRRRWYRPLTIP